MNVAINRKLILNILLFVVMIGVIIFVIRDSLSEIFTELGKTSWPVLLGVTMFGVISQVIEGYTIKNIANEFNREFSIRDGFFASAYATFYRVVTFGTGSIVSEVIYYHKKKLRYSEGTGTSALRMITYKIALMIWALFFLVVKNDAIQRYITNGTFLVIAGIFVTLLIVSVLLILSLNINAQVLLIIFCNRWFKHQKLRDIVDRINNQVYSLRAAIKAFIHDRNAVIRVFCSNMAKLVVWYFLPFFILVQEHPTIDIWLTVALISFTVILGGVLPAPGGIGGFEFVYVLLFRNVVGKVDAVSSLLLYRYATYLLPFLIGMIYVLFNKQRQINHEFKKAKKRS
ncbi:lysylphosphatidylglycerol synthase transmembrane domain-containing protein [Enterococcus dongliensis]|uniref:Phosphatidylglycerol lysyltransferase n=1 Tax=Enterococcus dongliensis TaxID=2559925 RepID=A0AAP5NKI4_9ENTE|nr:lysylphosphatidylglycerol synthase transmembrane domain-containing protein [Enterococcus dongliensis]MDT2595890.1 lysylphosphatidylglycerol synthase transmembrane domain-containing protein [Enterococcus dongliensis]MDT2602849.1 lysylphosphatidylglycerol synthase transmembrane domain-containing protein [Enterococcus dongliensis]MDT2633957.1 lysylphosphatidylglycerol synthase transmembrane domain-containing protein [Enterococcus dongliensis]MDT2637281.1 lysylphosphatidylglycerol synthase trans